MFDNSWHLTIPLVVAKFPIIETNRTQIIILFYFYTKEKTYYSRSRRFTSECTTFDDLDFI